MNINKKTVLLMMKQDCFFIYISQFTHPDNIPAMEVHHS